MSEGGSSEAIPVYFDAGSSPLNGLARTVITIEKGTNKRTPGLLILDTLEGFGRALEALENQRGIAIISSRKADLKKFLESTQTIADRVHLLLDITEEVPGLDDIRFAGHSFFGTHNFNATFRDAVAAITKETVTI